MVVGRSMYRYCMTVYCAQLYLVYCMYSYALYAYDYEPNWRVCICTWHRAIMTV